MRILNTTGFSDDVVIESDNGKSYDLMDLLISAIHIELKPGERVKVTLELHTVGFDLDQVIIPLHEGLNTNE